MKGRGVGWILDENQRRALLFDHTPRYPRVIAHHVTLWSYRDARPVPAPASIELVGHADAGAGIECLVAAVDGETRRPDGNIFHVTWSLDPQSGKVPKDSNTLLASHGWTAFEEPIPIATRPDYL